MKTFSKANKTATEIATQHLSAQIRGAERVAYFAQPGATLAGWKGTANVHTNRRHDASRKACRDRRNWD